VDWSPGRGSEPTGRRPALVIQTDATNANDRYPNTIVATVSTKGRPVPSHVELVPSRENGLAATSFVKCEQIITISKDRLEQRLGSVDEEDMGRVAAALRRMLVL
jgi:mRNA interferase MazF